MLKMCSEVGKLQILLAAWGFVTNLRTGSLASTCAVRDALEHSEASVQI